MPLLGAPLLGQEIIDYLKKVDLTEQKLESPPFLFV